MGGRGSGHYSHGSGNGRPTIGECLRIDAWRVYRAYHKRGAWFTWHWSQGGEECASVSVRVLPDAVTSPTLHPCQGPGAVVFSYRHTPSPWHGGEPRDVENVVPLTWTSPHYGGRRPWFLCTGCARRVGVLILGGGAVLCRRCRGLAYEVQRERRSYRLMRRRDKLLARLGPDGERPKGMHWRTYARIREEADAADCLSLAVGLEEIQGLIGHRLPGM